MTISTLLCTQLALKVLDGRQWKTKTLIAKVAPQSLHVVVYAQRFVCLLLQEANPAPDPLYQRKRVRQQDTAAMEAKRAKIENMSLEERYTPFPIIDFLEY